MRYPIRATLAGCAAAAALALPLLPAPALAAGYQDMPVGPGDVIRVQVFGVPELERLLRITEDGRLTLPLLGAIPIAGLTVPEAEAFIAEALTMKRLAVDPQVSLFVEELVSRGVSVQGAVAKPGVHQMISERTVLEMIGKAGGVTEEAGGRILVYRRGSSGPETVETVDGRALLRDGDVSADLPVRPGDTIVVPAVEKARVYVSGAVREERMVEFSSEEGMTLLRAVAAAGGPSGRREARRVSVVRYRPGGEEERLQFDLAAIQAGSSADVFLQPEDLVVVGQ